MILVARILLSSALLTAALPTAAETGEADRLLSNSLLEIRQNKMDSALVSIDKLLDRYPNFRLAQLVRGDILLARMQPLTTLGNARGSRDQQDDLRDEAKARIKAINDPVEQNFLPEELLQLSSDIRYAFAVDASRARLYVFENSPTGIRRVADYYVTVGKLGTGKVKEGDKRTPIGLYTITGFKPDSELEELYGAGAYPLSYPNEWDARNGHNGHGIWLHGVPRDTYARPPKASDGCVVLSNDDLKSLSRFIKSGLTPVIIAPELSWADPEALTVAKDDLNEALNNWKRDWESLDTNRLLTHYSQKFRVGDQTLGEFSESKRRVNASKNWVTVALTNLSIYRQPNSSELAIVTFEQDYKSNNLNNVSRKRQYWQRESGRWRIINETIL